METARTPILIHGSPEKKRQEILDYFNRTYDLYERLFECMASDTAYFVRPEMLRHPLIFYLGHTGVFYVNKLFEANAVEHRVDPGLESMLAVGVDEMSWDDLDESHYDWPTVERVREYRSQVRDLVTRFISTAPIHLPIDWPDPFWAIMMGIEHERIHLETSSVLIRQLDIGYVQDSPLWPRCTEDRPYVPENSLVHVSGRTLSLGRSRPGSTYGWDNEYGSLNVDVNYFWANRYLISNAQYMNFINDGGYADSKWWTEEGWSWRTYKEATAPPFWIGSGGTFRFRTMTSEIDLPMSWPAEVNFHEAQAYSRWESNRTGHFLDLPTEAEWYCMYANSMHTDYPLWTDAPGNINLEHYASSCPVDQFRQGDLYDVVGNVWQWTTTPIEPYPGFSIHPLYDDFSVPTFDGRHNIIKGGSWISTGNEACKESRYAFRRHFYQHAGLRLIDRNQSD